VVLDREVGDAAPRIELVGRRDRAGRAGRQAALQLPQRSLARAPTGSGRSV
jgi:hypothetical protein